MAEYRAACYRPPRVVDRSASRRASDLQPAGNPSALISALQQTAGNHATAQLLRKATIPVVQRGPGGITRADQQIDFELHPEKTPGQPKSPGWRGLSLRGGTQIVYILTDTTTGEALKVGKTTRQSFKSRFAEYVSAGNKWGRRLKITMFTLRRRPGKSIGMFETEIRTGMEKVGHRLPWDNTNGRLGRIGKGIPIPKDLPDLQVIDRVEAHKAAEAKAPPSPTRTPIASGPPRRVPIASGGSSTGTTTPPTTGTPNATTPKTTGRITGGRAVGAGIKVLGVVGSLGTLEALKSAFAGLGPQVDLEGLDPGDYDVGHRFDGISIGGGWYIDVRVERNIIFRKKFYVVRAYEIV